MQKRYRRQDHAHEDTHDLKAQSQKGISKKREYGKEKKCDRIIPLRKKKDYNTTERGIVRFKKNRSIYIIPVNFVTDIYEGSIGGTYRVVGSWF